MLTWEQADNHQALWAKVAAAPEVLLMLDYDGTLAPFTAERDRAWPYDGVRESLRRLAACNGIVPVIVSGRQCHEIPPLLDLGIPLEVWGGHGAERQLPGAQCEKAALSGDLRQRLDDAFALACGQVCLRQIERKTFSVAVHVRGMDSGTASSVLDVLRGQWTLLASDAALEILPFECGLELRVAGFSKARAVTQLLKDHPLAAAFYLGDDKTDEDAFRVLVPVLASGDRTGAAVLVTDRPAAVSAAQWHLVPPVQLLAFLSRLAACRC
jgi:trehalose-phosphatase